MMKATNPNREPTPTPEPDPIFGVSLEQLCALSEVIGYLEGEKRHKKHSVLSRSRMEINLRDLQNVLGAHLAR
jgi:hypothetical protein